MIRFDSIGRLRAAVGTLLLPISGVSRRSNDREWEELQRQGYHPEIDQILERYQRDLDTKDRDGWIHFLGDHLSKDIDLRGKTFLEIGHGGGWYLAQSLRAGASWVYGVEISETANQKARQALGYFGYTSFSLYKPVARGLEDLPLPPIDVVLSLTVFQHLAPDLLSDYLWSLSKNLSLAGVIYMQTLENDKRTKIRKSPHDVLSVSYSPKDVRELIERSGLEIEKRVRYEYSESQNYWGIYCLRRKTP